ncbi:hypothetical protein HPB48_015636 [Haemaphysalis longicornis]|uniref:Uncharacterized protein n=1 Tax=Haemaphysalis longicornis TaxID=44386 RepID=A0A9J6GCX3_HAELO|nr:hypothetical protein HPB48_015636 [Haemaphysalis longicornis]
MSSLGRGAGRYFGTVLGGGRVRDIVPVRDDTAECDEDADGVPWCAEPVAHGLDLHPNNGQPTGVPQSFKSVTLTAAVARREQVSNALRVDSTDAASFSKAADPEAGACSSTISPPATRYACAQWGHKMFLWHPQPLPKPKATDFVVVLKARTQLSLSDAFPENGAGRALIANLGATATRLVTVVKRTNLSVSLQFPHPPDRCPCSDTCAQTLDSCYEVVTVRSSDTEAALRESLYWPEGEILHVRRLATSSKVGLTFSGKVKPRYVSYDALVIPPAAGVALLDIDPTPVPAPNLTFAASAERRGHSRMAPVPHMSVRPAGSHDNGDRCSVAIGPSRRGPTPDGPTAKKPNTGQAPPAPSKPNQSSPEIKPAAHRDSSWAARIQKGSQAQVASLTETVEALANRSFSPNSTPLGQAPEAMNSSPSEHRVTAANLGPLEERLSNLEAQMASIGTTIENRLAAALQTAFDHIPGKIAVQMSQLTVSTRRPELKRASRSRASRPLSKVTEVYEQSDSSTATSEVSTGSSGGAPVQLVALLEAPHTFSSKHGGQRP